MLERKEIITLFIVTLVLGFTLSLKSNLQNILMMFGLVFLILIINTFAKKIAAYYLDSEIEISPWEIHRYGLFHFFNFSPFKTHPVKKFQRPLPIGLILPLITAVLTIGNLVWMASTTFDIKKKVYRAAKRYGLYTFSEVTEYHIGIVAMVGILANLFFAFIGYLMGWTDFSQLNILFAFFNSIPISNLDGNKVFFGSIVMWAFTMAMVLIAVSYLILVV